MIKRYKCFKYQSIITPNEEQCFICHHKAIEGHHIFYGSSKRKKSDEDGLVIPICRKCHSEIHDKHKHTHLFRLGEIAYCNAYGKTEDEFRQRYGKNYLCEDN